MIDADVQRLVQAYRDARKGRASFRVNIRVRMGALHSSEHLERVLRTLKFVQNEQVMTEILRRAVLQTVVSNVRRRYMNTMERALEMHVLKENGRDVKNSPKQRFLDLQLKGTLSRTLERLNDAQLDQNYERADALRTRAYALAEELQKQMNLRPNKRPIESHRFSVMAGNQFRRQMLAMLGVITNAKFVGAHAQSDGLVVGVGPKSLMDVYETPSATFALTGRPTKSKYKSFWRHLEFGTGMYRNPRKDAENDIQKPPSVWWYGRRMRASLELRGTRPMNFLTDIHGNVYQEDTDALTRVLTKELDQLLTVTPSER